MKITRLFIQLLLAVLILAASDLLSQEYTISGTDVRGNVSTDKALILSVSDLAIGSIWTPTITQSAIRLIYGLGLFSDVRIMGEITGNNNIALVIEVEEYPRLTKVEYKGNKAVKEKDLREIDSLKAGQLISPNEIMDCKNRIKKRYQEKGFYLAEIASELQKTSDSLSDCILKLTVKEGPKIRIKDVQFVGNKVFTSSKLAGKMGNKAKGFFRSGNYDPEKSDKDKEKVLEFYRKNGYMDASIISDTVLVHEDNPRWMTLQYEIDEGIRYHFGETNFSGNKIFGQKDLENQLKYHRDDVYSPQKFEESMNQLYSLYMEDGYIHAKIYEDLSTVDSTLNVAFEITEGVPARINRVEIAGNTKTKEKVIRREMFSRPGQVFKRSVLMRSVRNIMLLNYFSKAEPDFKVLDNGDVDLIMNMEEKPTGQFNAGVGYSASDKLVGTVSLGMPNFRGNGQNATLSVEFGKRRNSVSFSFAEPWFFDTPTSFSFSIYNLNRSWYDDFWEGRRGSSISFGRRLHWPDDYFRIYGGYRIEETRYYDFVDSTQYPSIYGLGGKWLKTSSVSANIVRDSRDLPLFPTKGSLYNFTSEYAGGPLGGEWEYHKHVFEFSKFFRILWKFVLAGKMRVGVVDSPDGDNGVPFSEKFTPGGTDPDGIIRGYDDGDIIPRTATYLVVSSTGDSTYRTDKVPGRAVLVYNAELQFPIVEQQIYGLLFADAGNSWLAGYQISPFNKKQLFKSFGAGFRVVVPGVGIIGFDFGYGINAENPGWKPHFQMGTTF